LASSRELAQQISKICDQFSKGIIVQCVYGGVKHLDYNLLKKCDILVATPGNLVSKVSNGSISLMNVSYLVLDEADKMLGPSFEPVSHFKTLITPKGNS
jgi:superfamily II DNA/RNA helicase